MFDLLGDLVEGARVLDLYAGSGALGLEALSRGSSRALFVDSWKEAAGAIRENIDRLGLASRAAVRRGEVVSLLRAKRSSVPPFDLIFADPPYRFHEPGGEGEKLLELLDGCVMVAPEAVAVVEYPRKLELSATPNGWREAVRRRYGAEGVVIYRRIPRSGGGVA